MNLVKYRQDQEFSEAVIIIMVYIALSWLAYCITMSREGKEP